MKPHQWFYSEFYMKVLLQDLVPCFSFGFQITFLLHVVGEGRVV